MHAAGVFATIRPLWHFPESGDTKKKAADAAGTCGAWQYRDPRFYLGVRV